MTFPPAALKQPPFVKHLVKALSPASSASLLVFLFLFFFCAHMTYPLIKRTSDYGIVSESLLDSTEKGKLAAIFNPNTHTLHPVSLWFRSHSDRQQLQWQIVRRFSFWHAKSLITSVCSQRVYPGKTIGKPQNRVTRG